MEDTKRRRLWNPAVEEAIGKDSSPEPNQPSQVDHRVFALAAFAAQQQFMQQQLLQMQHHHHQPNPLPLLFQPYLSMALPLLNSNRNLQQRIPEKRKTPVRVKSVSPSESMHSSSPPSSSTPSTSSSSLTPSFNPIVKSALGIHVPNENCCAVCGACFRLTTDLVTHMRNNHRRNKFKRKSDE